MFEAAKIAEDFTIGNTRIRIATDSCRTAPDEIQKILDEVAMMALIALRAAENKRGEGNDEQTEKSACNT